MTSNGKPGSSMKSISVTRKLGLGATAIVLAAAISVASTSHAQNTMELSKERVALMKEMGKNLGMIGRVVKGEMEADYPNLADAAEVIRDNAIKVRGLFPPGSGGSETRALPVIWEKKADFDEGFTKLADAAGAFAVEANTGGMVNIETSFRAMAATCGACHREYRAEKN